MSSSLAGKLPFRVTGRPRRGHAHGPRPRPCETMECPGPAPLTFFLLQITRPGSASRFPPRSSHLDSLSPSPQRPGASTAVLSLSQRLSAPCLRSAVCACAHTPRVGWGVGASLSQEPPGRPLAASPSPGAHTKVPLAGESAAREGLWPRAGVRGCVHPCGVYPGGALRVTGSG